MACRQRRNVDNVNNAANADNVVTAAIVMTIDMQHFFLKKNYNCEKVLFLSLLSNDNDHHNNNNNHDEDEDDDNNKNNSNNNDDDNNKNNSNNIDNNNNRTTAKEAGKCSRFWNVGQDISWYHFLTSNSSDLFQP